MGTLSLQHPLGHFYWLESRRSSHRSPAWVVSLLSRAWRKSLQIPGYEIYERLGTGAQGEVYRALHIALDREVALKIVRHDGDQASAALLAKEAKVLADLDHPGIVHVFDYGEVDDLSFMAMELLEGTDLAQHIETLIGKKPQQQVEVDRDSPTIVLDRSTTETIALPFRVDVPQAAAPATKGQLAPKELRGLDHVLWTLETAGQICEALAAVHAAGVLHRDLKPANIMLVEGRGAVITDFGTVHAPNRATFMLEPTLVGTPAYMSPEQADEHPLDQRSDLYSLAATIYHLIAGRPPFAQRTVTAVLRALDRREPEALRKINPALPTAFAKVIAKAMAKDVRDRFASAAELGATLERVRHGEKLGRLWSVPGIYRRTKRWHLPVATTLLVVFIASLWNSPTERIRNLIGDGQLADAAQVMRDDVDRTNLDSIMADLRGSILPGQHRDLETVFAVATMQALVHVRANPHFRAAIGPTDAWFQIKPGTLPTTFTDLSETAAFFAVEPGHHYLYLLDKTAVFSDGSPRVYYLPLKLAVQTLDGRLSHDCNLALLPQRSFRSEFPLADPKGEWLTFEPGSYAVLKAKGETANVALSHALIVHKYEVPRLTAHFYEQWCRGDEHRQSLFAHPGETEDLGIMAEIEAIDHTFPKKLSPVKVSYWAAFRIAGFLGCRMPTLDDFLLAAQDGRQDISPEKCADSTDSNATRDIDWKITKCWDITEGGLANMHSYPTEWTTTPATLLRASIRQTMWCLFEDRHRSTRLGFTPTALDNVIFPKNGRSPPQRGFRLFRDRFPSHQAPNKR